MYVIYLKLKRIGYSLILAAALMVAGTISTVKIPFLTSSTAFASQPQTDVDRAAHILTSDGIPMLEIEGVGKVNHPAWTALYALAYAGLETYDPKFDLVKDKKKFRASIQWLIDNLKRNNNGLWVWEYEFNSTYNDVSMLAPWSSAFAQAVGIQALLASYRLDANEEALEAAEKAAISILTGVHDGGFLFRSGNDVWFEEIVADVRNPSHILNGHMRALLALSELFNITHNSDIKEALDAGLDTLYKWLPLYDTGYWFRYDLNPKKNELLFRFANPYGYKNIALAIDKISLTDPLSKKSVVLDVGADSDAAGSVRIAGTEWGAREEFGGRTIRRLIPSELDSDPVEMGTPYTYFYLELPTEWEDNLRRNGYVLEIEYFDEAAGNIAIQHRSIAPGAAFRNMPAGDLHLTGSSIWRKWKLPIEIPNLGYWVGTTYAEKHSEYLEKLSQLDERFMVWASRATGYLQLASDVVSAHIRNGGTEVPPTVMNTPVVPLLSLDGDGVVMQHFADKYTKWHADGTFDSDGGKGTPAYSPYLIAQQLLEGSELAGAATFGLEPDKIKRKPALNWLLDPKNYKDVKGAHIYNYDFDNVYNDIVTKAPWPSAFGQAYVLKSLTYADEEEVAPRLDDAILAAANAYRVQTIDGGISTTDKSGFYFYEEVPNNTHVLNAHLVSIPELAAAGRFLGNNNILALSEQGIMSLRQHLHLYDSGYWLRYDLNPKKALLFQLDWLEGEQSPLIEEILFSNPETSEAVRIGVGSDEAFAGLPRLSGAEWESAKTADGRQVRTILNGYKVHKAPVQGGSRQNSYFFMPLPTNKFVDYFDVPVHRLTIRYKDIAKGRFKINIQSINRGNELGFVPLREPVWETTGDGAWKETTFFVRPQDMGWYKGPDYQRYELEQLRRIANQTNDWYFYQYLQRQEYYLEKQEAGEQVIQTSHHSSYTDSKIPTIEEASETYPGFGYQNSLDADIFSDYTAGKEGEEHYVVVQFPTAVDLTAINFIWESEENFANEITVRKVLEHGELSESLISDVVRSPDGSSLAFLEHGEGIGLLRIDFAHFNGQNRLLLRKVEFRETARGSTMKSSPSVTRSIYLSGTDDENPLNIFRVPITNNVKQLADNLTEGVSTDHERILKLMQYISGFSVGFASGASPDVTIAERVGACGTYTGTLLAFAASAGLKGRYVNLYNYPDDAGHTVAEIYIDGKWRLYDPTYSAFYLLKSDEEAGPLGFKEIVKAYKDSPDSVKRVARTYRPGLEEYTGYGIFMNANPLGVIGPEHPMDFPLTLDTNNSVLTAEDFGTHTQGASLIGVSAVNQSQVWSLDLLEVGRRYSFEVRASALGGDLKVGDTDFELEAQIINGSVRERRGHVYDFQHGEPEPWVISFIAKSENVDIKLTHRYGGPNYRYIRMKSYKLLSHN